MKTIAIYDTTVRDDQSRVRGIGRCIQTLKESFEATTTLYFSYIDSIKALRPEMIFLNPFFNFIQKPLMIRRRAHAQIAIIHDLMPMKYPKSFPIGLRGKWYKLLNTYALKSYDHIIAVSEHTKKDIIKMYSIPPEKIRVIYPTVPRLFLPHLDTSDESVEHHHPFHTQENQTVAEFTPLPQKLISTHEELRNLKDFAIYVGDATWNKNLPNIARAIKQTNIPCVFVGKVFGDRSEKNLSVKPHPWQNSLFEFFQLVENDPRFIFPGYVSDLELKMLYKNAKLNLLVSYDEGFGYSYVEAGYMSTPSVLADTPIFHEVAGDAAVFANPQDPKDIAQKMSELFYDRVKREKMSIKAFDRAQRYNPEKFQQDWIEVFN